MRAAGHGQEAGHVLGVPGAGQVGLAEADEAVAAEPGVELVGPVHAHDRSALAEGQPGGLLDDGHREAAYGGPEELAGDRGGDRGAWSRAQRLERGEGVGRGAGVVGGRGGGEVCGCPGGGRVVERHRTPSWWWVGRGRTGRRRAHSQMPWTRMRRLPRRAAASVRRIGTSLRVPVERGTERGGVLAPVGVVPAQGDGHVQPVGRHRHGDVVPAVDAVERRDVHGLVGAGPALLVGVDEVGVPVAVGVVHLDHHGRLGARVVEAPEHADRVEAVAQRPRVGGHQDAAGRTAVGTGAEGDAVVGEERLDVAPQAPGGVAEVVARLEPGQQAVVGQVVEVDEPERRAVLEAARDRRTTRVPDGRLEAAGPDRGGRARGAPTAARAGWPRPGRSAHRPRGTPSRGRPRRRRPGRCRSPPAGPARRRTRGCRAGARTPSGRSPWPGRRGARRPGSRGSACRWAAAGGG